MNVYILSGPFPTLVAEDVADLDKLNGLQPIIAELDSTEEELRTTAAWVLGKACQNNLVVQKQVWKL